MYDNGMTSRNSAGSAPTASPHTSDPADPPKDPWTGIHKPLPSPRAHRERGPHGG
jgi:hypothetical protein